jgi:hypothetical protein
MKRMFWLGVGLAAGAYMTRRATEAAHNLTPAGIGANLADGLRELGAGLGAFGAEVRAGMNAREQELTELLERRTGAGVPTLVESLQDPVDQPAAAAAALPVPPTPAPRARTPRSRAPGAGA